MSIDIRPDEATPCAPCMFACPLHTDVQGYVTLIAQGRFGEALDLIREVNPLVWSLGAICPHPCETECRRSNVDEPVSICMLKRSAAEFGGERPPITQSDSYSERIAVIGSGPAGLTAALELFRLGYLVTIFDRNDAAGGTLQTGVPTYRLPREALSTDSGYLERSGVEFRQNVAIGRDVQIDELFAQGYSAVVIAVGLQVSRNLNIPGIDHPGVILALPFLKETNETQRYADVVGRSLVIIGGGSVATDVARSALRVGARRVTLVCLESREEMPAQPWEIVETLEEGAELICSRGPKQVVIEGDEIKGVEFTDVISVFDEQGRFNPTFNQDKISFVEGDRLVVAIGQGSDLSFLEGTGVEVDPRGRLVLDRNSWMTSRPGVFAAGDVAKGPGPAVDAMANALTVARSVHRFLRTGEVAAVPEALAPMGKLEETTISRVPHSRRHTPTQAPVEVRLAEFNLPDQGFEQAVAVAEAQRCMSCAAGAVITMARCPECLTCLRICPFGVPRIEDGRLYLPLDQCQACALCARECPAQAIQLRREEDVTAIINAALEGISLDAGPVILIVTCQYSPEIKAAVSQPAIAQSDAVVRVAPVLCVGRLGQQHYLRALEYGATGVLVVACNEDECRYVQGTHRAEERITRTKELLRSAGLGEHRIQGIRESAATTDRIVQAVMELAEATVISRA